MRTPVFKYLEYDPETGLFHRIRRSISAEKVIAGAPTHEGYVRIYVDGRSYMAHRLAWFFMTGEWPGNLIDHKNLVKSDNRWCNLREATRAQNSQNSRPQPGKLRGVTALKWGRYQAQIKTNSKYLYLGSFDTPEQAHAAYCAAAEKYFGEFARVA